MEVSESSSSFTSTEPPPFDHQQSANSIHDQLDAISLEPQNDANNNGDRYAAHSEERENEQNLQEEKKEVDKVTNLIENERGDEIDKEKEFEVVNENEDEIEKEKEFGEVGEGEREKSKRIRFPVRPEAEDCSFYLRTGMCKFGMNCKFNHPPDRKSQVKIVLLLVHFMQSLSSSFDWNHVLASDFSELKSRITILLGINYKDAGGALLLSCKVAKTKSSVCFTCV